MRKLKIFAFFIILSTNLFGETYQDLDGLTHNIELNATWVYGYKDLNIGDDQVYGNLHKRTTNSVRIFGDIETIGATIMVPEDGGFNFQYGSGSGGSVIRPFEFIKEDKDIPVNSAKSTFKFDNEFVQENLTGDNIIFARLYWGGGLSKFWEDDYKSKPTKDEIIRETRAKYFEEIRGFNKIKFKTPDGTIHDIEATSDRDIKWYGSYSRRGMQFMYQASADVTDIVRATFGKNIKSRTFSAGNIRTFKEQPKDPGGFRDHGWNGSLAAPHYGGWVLTIIYDFTEKVNANLSKNNQIKPRGVHLYDGISILAPYRTTKEEEKQKIPYKIAESLIDIDGFFTPTRGKVNSTLTVLSFGAKKELGSENIEIQKAADKRFYPATSNVNPAGGQFNSTIAKFDKHMDENKKFNAQMDLDILDISNHISNKQTSTKIRLNAKVVFGYSVAGNINSIKGERANIGLVAFSTELYQPNVCYVETLFHRIKGSTDERDFREVSKDSNSATQARPGDDLRVKLVIKNTSNEEALFTAVRSMLDPKSLTYTPKSTYAIPSVNESINDNFSMISAHKQSDTNSPIFKKQENTLKFLIGEGAGINGNGGKLTNQNKAFIQYDTVLVDKFKQNSYQASFENKTINLVFDGTINKCEDDKYHLIVIRDILTKVVNKNFNQVGDSENLFTQISGKPFSVKLANFDTTYGAKALYNFNEDNNIYIDAIEDNSKCSSGANILANNKKIKLSKDDLENKSVVDVRSILINDAYKKVYFRISVTDKEGNQISTSCSSDPFSVRPKELDGQRSMSGLNYSLLVGGKKYNTIEVIAKNNNGQKTDNYTTDIKPIKFIAPSPLPTGCDSSKFNFLSNIELAAVFDNGIAKLKVIRNEKGLVSNSDFYYPNVGQVSIKNILDTKWTLIDQTSSKEDCILNSYSNDEIDGKIGCNVRLKDSINFTFIPKDIHVSEVNIKNFSGTDMTYMSNDSDMSARMDLKTTARLEDNSPATLYTKNCYSRDVNLTIDINKAVTDITDDSGLAIASDSDKIAQAKKDILYFDNLTMIKADNNPNSGKYQIKKNHFEEGEVRSYINFGFSKNIQIPKNPFQVTSDNFTFLNIQDEDGVTGSTYAPNTIKTDVKFYYGRVFAPDYTGPMSGFDAHVYYGLFCKNCVETKYTSIIKNQTLPTTSNWFVNKSHSSPVQGTAGNYEHPSNIALSQKNPANPIVSGVEKITLSSLKPDTVTIFMPASKWLIFNPFNPSAEKNSFDVTFIGGSNWGGQSLNKNKEDVGVGNLVGGDSNKNFKDIQGNKTNQRLNW